MASPGGDEACRDDKRAPSQSTRAVFSLRAGLQHELNCTLETRGWLVSEGIMQGIMMPEGTRYIYNDPHTAFFHEVTQNKLSIYLTLLTESD